MDIEKDIPIPPVNTLGRNGPRLTPEQIAELQRRFDAYRQARLDHVKALKAYDRSLLKRSQAKEAKRIAAKENIEYYQSLGLSRQSSWQIYNVSKGLCRICGQPEDAKGGLCEKHRPGRWK